MFPELPDLAERGLRDGVGPLYQNAARRGELLLAGRRVSDVNTLLREALERWGAPGLVVADRWREAELREKFEAVGFPFCPLEVRGQGFRDGGTDTRDFRAACLSDGVHPEKSLSAEVCAGGSAHGKRRGGQRETVETDARRAPDASS